jgi:rhodanese-related sulfurtransferase
LHIESSGSKELGMDHSPGFLNLVNEAKRNIKEVTIEQARDRLSKNARAVLMDVREDSEWQKQHAIEAVHLGKGVLERDLEQQFPDQNQEIIMYCGGGFRSALTAEAAQKMGYRNVYSLAGGYKALVKANWPMKSGG